jgi:inner membrane protein
MEFITTITPLHWFIFGLALVGFEVIIPSTFLLWPGISALLVAGLAWILPTGAYTELVIFAVLAVATSIFWQVWLSKRHTETDHPELNRRALQYIGRKAVLREALEDGFGYLTLDDTRWRVEAEDGSNITEGTRVEIMSVEGNSFKIKRVVSEAAQTTS